MKEGGTDHRNSQFRFHYIIRQMETKEKNLPGEKPRGSIHFKGLSKTEKNCFFYMTRKYREGDIFQNRITIKIQKIVSGEDWQSNKGQRKILLYNKIKRGTVQWTKKSERGYQRCQSLVSSFQVCFSILNFPTAPDRQRTACILLWRWFVSA